MFKQEIEIKSLDEVTEQDTKYWFVNAIGLRTGKWIEIEQDSGLDNEFCVNYKTRAHQLYHFITKGNYVRTWKTFGGALRYAKKHLNF